MRPEKKSMVAEVQNRVQKGTCMILVDCRGMKVEGLTDLRVRLRGAGGRLQVVKNSYLRVAAGSAGLPEIDSMLTGPTAVIVGQGDAAILAKTLTTFAKENKCPVIKGGLLGSKRLAVSEISDMADLPSREVMIAVALGTLEAPIRNLVGVMNQKVLSLLYALKAVGGRKQDGV